MTKEKNIKMSRLGGAGKINKVIIENCGKGR
jgi:hypothetical protein